MILSNKELSEIQGGFKWITAGALGTAVSFLIGLIDGYIRPLSCEA